MLLRLDGDGARYAQITRAIAQLIQSGALGAGTRLPPTRSLAQDLGCARNLVLLAYEQLGIEGYLVSRGSAGTFVAPGIPARPSDTARVTSADAPVLSAAGRRIAESAAAALAGYRGRAAKVIDFAYGVFEPDARMVAALRSAFTRALADGAFGYPRAAGDEELRRLLALRLQRTRGVRRGPGSLLLTSGAQQALDVCTRLLVEPGDRVVIEDPSYEGANSVFAAAGAKILRVPVDAHGIVVDRLPEHGPSVRLVYVTPSHHFPTGVIMSAARRYALLAWARRRNAIIFEDDYDSEFRYAGRPLEALAALDNHELVVYCGSFAKTLFPALRLAYLSLPESLATAAVGCKWIADRGTSLLIQCAVRELMTSGEYDRHLRRTQRTFRARRDALVRALRDRLGGHAVIAGADAGAHVVVWLKKLTAAQLEQLIGACAARGVGVYSAATGPAVHASRSAGAGLLLGYGLVDVPEIERGVATIADAYRRVVRAGERLRT